MIVYECLRKFCIIIHGNAQNGVANLTEWQSSWSENEKYRRGSFVKVGMVLGTRYMVIDNFIVMEKDAILDVSKMEVSRC